MALIEDAGNANQHLHLTFKSAGGATRAIAAKVSAAVTKASGKATGKLSANQMRGLLYAQGFRGHDLDVAVAIGMAESGGKSVTSKPNSDGTVDRGFMQINSSHGAMSTLDPTGSAAAAFKLYKSRGGFGDWTTFNSGAYKQFMDKTGSGKGSSSSAGGNSGGSLADAKKALADFDKATARTKRLARIDIQIKNLEQLKAFKDAIKNVRDQLTTMAASAAAAWRTLREKDIDKAHDAAIAALAGTAQAQELAALQAKDAAESDAKEKAGLDKALTDAKASGDVTAISDAQDAIAAYQRKKREDELTAWIQNETTKADSAQQTAKDGLDAEEAAYKTSLENRLQALAENLAAGKISYATFASEVQGVLDGLHLPAGIPGFDGNASDEATINAGAGPAAVLPSLRMNGKPVTRQQWESGDFLKSLLSKPKRRARGGDVLAGHSYFVGELGPEEFTPAVDGHVTPNGKGDRGRSGPMVYIQHYHANGAKSAEVLANRLAHKVAFS
jgi:hypothetical protein